MFLLFVMALSAAFVMLGHALFDFGLDAPRAGFGTGAVIVALLGAPFVIWRAIVAQKQADVAEQGHITDRINKAVEGLGTEKVVSRVWRNVTYKLDGEVRTGFEGRDEDFKLPEGAQNVERGEWKVADRTKPNLEVRIGAIYALERIAQDSDRDHVQIMEILCTYIRQNSPARSAIPVDVEVDGFSVKSWLPEIPIPRIDIQTALYVLGRRNEGQIKIERELDYRFDLTSTNLQRANFQGLNFAAADFTDSYLDASSLEGAEFSDAIFKHASMIKCQFSEAKLAGASFFAADLQYAKHPRFLLEAKTLMGAILRGTTFHNCHISDDFLSCYLDECTFVDCLFEGMFSVASNNFKNARHMRTALRNLNVIEFAKPDDDLSIYFGDGSVITTGYNRPDIWPKDELSFDDYLNEYRLWRHNQTMYLPPHIRA